MNSCLPPRTPGVLVKLPAGAAGAVATRAWAGAKPRFKDARGNDAHMYIK